MDREPVSRTCQVEANEASESASARRISEPSVARRWAVPCHPHGAGDARGGQALCAAGLSKHKPEGGQLGLEGVGQGVVRVVDRQHEPG